jgi:hypothetical protein
MALQLQAQHHLQHLDRLYDGYHTPASVLISPACWNCLVSVWGLAWHCLPANSSFRAHHKPHGLMG